MTEPNDIVGYALYIEMYKPSPSSSSQQILLTPEGMNAAGYHTPMRAYYRDINVFGRKRRWQQRSAAKKFREVDWANAEEAVQEIVPSVLNRLASIANSGVYSLRAQPAFVEVTATDLNDVAQGKLPYKVMGRVNKCREKLGYPADPLEASAHPV